MALFFSQRNKPRQFEYRPRHYNPEEEERAARRRALRAEEGRPLEVEQDEEYTPGSIIRERGFRSRQMVNRRERTAGSGRRMLRLVLILAVLILAAVSLMRWTMNF